MDGRFPGAGYAPHPYDYLDGRPVMFTPDGYPVQYQPVSLGQQAQQVQQQQQHLAYFPVQDIHGQDASVAVLHGFAPFDMAAHQTKHRRSRNGCYTCRTRRVKCDEKRPACERCRKGSRDCVYPQASDEAKQKLKSKRKGSSAQDSADAAPRQQQQQQQQQQRQPSSPADTTTLANEDSASDATSPPASSMSPTLQQSSASPFSSLTPQTSNDDHSRADTVSPFEAHASPDESSGSPSAVSLPQLSRRADFDRKPKFYLDYLGSAITHHHYALSHPCPELIPRFLVSSSFHFRPLLHAVVAFSAYHHGVQENAASLQDFIYHYSESVSQLRGHLCNNKGGSEISILLTILQLATIEEYLGDWANLINHQQAAAKVIFNIYTPESIYDPNSKIPASRIFDWYYHFDLFVSFIGGKGTTISREWYEAQHRHALELVTQDPSSLDYKLAERHAAMRIVGCDCSSFFGELKAGTLSARAIKQRGVDLMAQLDAILEEADATITDHSKVRVHRPEMPALSPGTDVPAGDNPWDPIEYYSGPLWSMNFLMMRLWGIKLMMLNHLRSDARPAHAAAADAVASSSSLSSPSSPLSSSGGADSRSSSQSPVSVAAAATAGAPGYPKLLTEMSRYAMLMLRMFSAIATHDPDPGAIMGAQAGLSFASNFVGVIPPSSSMPPGFDVRRAHAHSAWCRARLRDVELRGYIFPTGMRKRLADSWAVDVVSDAVGGWWFADGAGLSPAIRAIREFVVFRTHPPEDQLREDMREMNGLFATMRVGSGSGNVSMGTSDEEG